jgi:hypothetical protein
MATRRGFMMGMLAAGAAIAVPSRAIASPSSWEACKREYIEAARWLQRAIAADLYLPWWREQSWKAPCRWTLGHEMLAWAVIEQDKVEEDIGPPANRWLDALGYALTQPDNLSADMLEAWPPLLTSRGDSFWRTWQPLPGIERVACARAAVLERGNLAPRSLGGEAINDECDAVADDVLRVFDGLTERLLELSSRARRLTFLHPRTLGALSRDRQRHQHR